MQKDRITERFGGCCEDEELGVGRELTEPSREPIFDPSGNGMTLRQPEATREFRGAPRPRELEQGKRVPMALRDDLVADDRIQGSYQVLEEQGTRVRLTEWTHVQMGESSEDAITDLCSSGANQRDPLGKEASGHEPEDLHGRLIEPLRVVEDAHEWLLLRRLGEQ
jgi:hypothetical protein